MKKISGRIVSVLLLFALCLTIAGCEKEASWKKWTTERMAVEQDGKIIYGFVDSFEKNYYDIDELTGMVVKEVAEFNAQKKTGDAVPVTVLEVAKLEEDEGKVRVIYQFENSSYFTLFFGEETIYETLGEAIEKKHVFIGSVVQNGKEDLTLDEQNVAKLKEKHVLITKVKTKVTLPHDVAYYGYGVKMTSEEEADLSACEEEAILILKK